jgi:hypothetical protein
MNVVDHLDNIIVCQIPQEDRSERFRVLVLYRASEQYHSGYCSGAEEEATVYSIFSRLYPHPKKFEHLVDETRVGEFFRIVIKLIMAPGNPCQRKMWAQINSHPRDEKIKFYDHLGEDEHVYVIEGAEERPTSVTTLIKKYFPEFDQDDIIAKYYEKWQKYRHPKYFGKTPDEIKIAWEENRIECARLGTELHKTIEAYLNNELEEEPDTKEWGHFKRFWNELLTTKPDYRIYRTEWTIYNEKKTISGSIDAVLMKPNGKVVLLDWKRSKKIESWNDFGHYGLGPFARLIHCNFVHYCIQLNMYRRILETCYGLEVESMFFVVFHPDNESYLLFEVPDMQALVAPVIDNWPNCAA